MWQGYPLRPELIESTYLLHAATGDPHYLTIGRELQTDLANKAQAKCGYASIADVATGERPDLYAVHACMHAAFHVLALEIPCWAPIPILFGGHSAVCLLIRAITCIGVETQDMHGRLTGIPVAAKQSRVCIDFFPACGSFNFRCAKATKLASKDEAVPSPGHII